MSKIIIGETDISQVSFRNPSTGQLFDPSSVDGIVKKPDGSITAVPVTVTKLETGVYNIEVATDAAGLWYLTITGDSKKFEKTICVVRSSTTP